MRELAGEACIDWEDSPSDKQQIMCSRSFGRPVTELRDLQQAIAVFVTRAAEKLRGQHSYTDAVQVFICTSPFRDGPKRTGNTVVRLKSTNDTNALIGAVTNGLRSIYRPGFQYAKAGVCLLDIQQSFVSKSQLSLFDCEDAAPKKQREELMCVVDKLNGRYGRATVVAANALSVEDAPWQMRQERMTPAYTTDWAQVVEIWR